MKYIFTGILLCYSFLSFAQNGFSRIYEMENFKADKIQQIIQVADQLILIVSTDCDPIDGDKCLNIISTDLQGAELWRIQRTAHQIIDNMDIAFLWNDHIYVTVEDLSTATNDQPGQIQAFQIDLNGNIVDTHIVFFSVPESFRFDGIIANGDIFTVCSTIRLNDDQTQAKLSFYDPNFAWQGQKVISSETTNVGFQDIKSASDGGYILASNNFTLGVGYQLKVQKLTADGSTEWERVLEPSQFFTEVSLETNENGDIFIAYIRIEDFFNDPKRFLHVERLDNEGNETWVSNHYISSDEIRSYEGLFLTADDEMIYVGAGEVMGPSNGYSALAAKISSEGALEWEKSYRDVDLGGNSTDLLQGLALENGELILGGDLRNTIDIFGKDPWLLRTNANGCVYTDNCGDSNLITPTRDLTTELSDKFSIAPTLVYDQLTIRRATEMEFIDTKIRLLTASGQLVRELIIADFPYHLNTESIPAGFYFLEILEPSGGRQVLKFIRQ